MTSFSSFYSACIVDKSTKLFIISIKQSYVYHYYHRAVYNLYKTFIPVSSITIYHHIDFDVDIYFFINKKWIYSKVVFFIFIYIIKKKLG
ncbi:hypothetical protein BCR42DRAFT_428307 [Absidia repens]|uniref:Uncharacterized protein n=1 Tax=Absidia repens TaxID=90262 RepID=A0A1X2HYZ0_9FUNG|nr:hypothetical protein BCR42DRAFT_428307 [Absidia repens]